MNTSSAPDRIAPRPAAAGIPNAQAVGANADGAACVALRLMVAVVCAALVVASQVIHTLSDGPLLAAWLVFWLVTFGVLAVLAVPARRALVAWVVEQRRAAHEERLLESAQREARALAQMSRAMDRNAVARSAR